MEGVVVEERQVPALTALSAKYPIPNTKAMTKKTGHQAPLSISTVYLTHRISAPLIRLRDKPVAGTLESEDRFIAPHLIEVSRVFLIPALQHRLHAL